MSAEQTDRTVHARRARLVHVPNRLRAVCAVTVLVGVVCSGATSVVATPCWQPPVSAAVADPFRPPACRWCPGNRGIEYATSAGDLITSVAAGTVSFAGEIAGVSYVVVAIANGWRITYGNLSTIRFTVGETVVAGVAIGAAAGSFHFGVRDGDTYVDPTPYLGEWWFRVRLVPTDATRAAPGPPPTLRCEQAESTPITSVVPGRDVMVRR